jgi:ADP-glucose pyrophosphorylase
LPGHKNSLYSSSNNNVICNGCDIFGSVLSQKVIVDKGVQIIDSVLFSNIKVCENVRIPNFIIIKYICWFFKKKTW